MAPTRRGAPAKSSQAPRACLRPKLSSISRVQNQSNSRKVRKEENEQNGRSILGDLAPHRSLNLPHHIPITAGEILTIFPNAIRSHDFCERFVHAGITTEIACFYVRETRILDKPLVNNAMTKLIQSAMRNGPLYPMTSVIASAEMVQLTNINQEAPAPALTKKVKWILADRDDPRYINPNYDPADLTTDHLNVQGATNDRDISLLDLLRGVRRLPTGFDAFCLTEALRYAWTFPNHKIMLSDIPDIVEMLGGPKALLPSHMDLAAFTRWGDALDMHKKAVPDPYEERLYPAQTMDEMMNEAELLDPLRLPRDEHGNPLPCPFPLRAVRYGEASFNHRRSSTTSHRGSPSNDAISTTETITIQHYGGSESLPVNFEVLGPEDARILYDLVSGRGLANLPVANELSQPTGFRPEEIGAPSSFSFEGLVLDSM